MSHPPYERTAEGDPNAGVVSVGGELALRNSVLAEIPNGPEIQLSPEDEVRRDILKLSREATLAIAQGILAKDEPDWHAHLMADSLLEGAEGFVGLGLNSEAKESIRVYGEVMKQAPRGDAYNGLRYGLRVAGIYEQMGETDEAGRLYEVAVWGARHLLGSREIGSKEAGDIIRTVSMQFVDRGDVGRAREIIKEPIDQYEKKHLQDSDSYSYSERVTSQLIELAVYQAKKTDEPGAVRETVEAALEELRTVNVGRIGYEPSFIKDAYIRAAEAYLAIDGVLDAANALSNLEEIDDYGPDSKIAERVVRAAAKSQDIETVEAVLGSLHGDESRLRAIAVRGIGIDDDGARALTVAQRSSKPEIAIDMLTTVYDMASTENPSVANSSANKALEIARDVLRDEHEVKVSKEIVRSLGRITEGQTAETHEVVGETLGLLAEVMSTYDIQSQHVQQFVHAAIKFGDADLAMQFVRSVLPHSGEPNPSTRIDVQTIGLFLDAGRADCARELLPYISRSDASVYGAHIVKAD